MARSDFSHGFCAACSFGPNTHFPHPASHSRAKSERTKADILTNLLVRNKNRDPCLQHHLLGVGGNWQKEILEVVVIPTYIARRRKRGTRRGAKHLGSINN
jgi:hypothetical protein